MSIRSALKNAVFAHRAAASELEQGLSEIRARIAEARSELAEARDAQPDAAGIKARAEAIVLRLADEARERIQFSALAASETNFDGGDSFVARLGEATATGFQTPLGTDGKIGAVHVEVDIPLTGFHVEALMRPKELIAVFEREAARVQSGERIMSEKDRTTAIERLTAELDGLERDDEATCRAAEETGMTIERRIDADPRWLLAPDEELQAA
jgi:hypothetical protein